MKTTLLVIFALLFSSSTVFAQSVDATTHMGTSIVGKLKTSKLELVTKYGQLSILPEDIESIKFGYHVKPEMHDNITKWIKELSSVAIQQREKAYRELIENYRYSYLPLKNMVSKDREVSKRIETLLTIISEDKKNQFIPENTEDTINLWSGEIYKGTITNTELIVKSDELDNIPIDIIHVKNMIFHRKWEFTLKPSEIGKDAWFDTKIDIKRPCKINITGKIDLNPDDAGQYISGPNGLQDTWAQLQLGVGTWIQANSGSVYGKIGNETFKIGSYHRQAELLNGRLFLKIVPAPSHWEASIPTGSYKVTIE
ncbi:MAG TPA: hypothetical protein VFV86_12935 [Nitrososphaeraceae archaeon]|nr:hypothetical protein [Nitrososphaeraceae archaeon]